MRVPRDRGRVVTVLVSVACVVAVALGATVATSTLAPAVAFAQTGHWVVNSAESAAVHVDGGTRQVDARVELPSDIGDPLFALQGERQGFVVAADRIAVFGRSTLTVDATIPVEFAEVPVGIETLGGPYLVYREAGTIVRLGVPPLSLPVGGRLDRPVWTDDGTVWLHRPDNGSFCALRNGADALDCSAGAAPGEPGGLSITGELPAFVGTRQDAAQVIAARLGSPVGLGADVADAALLADRDTEGRLAVVESATNRLVLTDSSGVPDGRDGGAPVVVDLGSGTFTSPVAADGIVALLDTAANRLLTYDVTGRLITTLDLPPGTDAADLVRGGDGRIYVDDADGSGTHVVGTDGRVTSVGTGAGGVPTELVAVAAPPSRARSSVPPPPGSNLTGPLTRPGSTRSPVSGGGQVPGGPVSVPPGGPPPIVSPPLPPLPPPFAPAAAPTGLTATAVGSNPGGSTFRLSWTEPALNGGQLVRYEVSAVDALGAPVAGLASTAATVVDNVYVEVCTGPVQVTVRAVTRAIGGSTDTSGEDASTVAGQAQNCSINSRISASTVDHESIAVDMRFNGGAAFTSGACYLTFNGTRRWDGLCAVENVAGNQAVIGGLDPDTTYSIVLTIDSPGTGAQTNSNVVDARTATAPEPVPTERPSDINGDGQVGCLDQAILNAQWGQNGPELSADLNVDQTVNITDLSMLLTDWTGDSQQECEGQPDA